MKLVLIKTPNPWREKMDATAIAAILSVVGTVIVAVVLAVRIGKLMNTTNSVD